MNADALEKERARDEEEKRLFVPYPASNRHERRKAARLTQRRRSQPRRTPDVQIARGPTTSETYLKLRRAHKKHTTVQYQQRWYYVAVLKIGEQGMFEAKLVEAV